MKKAMNIETMVRLRRAEKDAERHLRFCLNSKYSTEAECEEAKVRVQDAHRETIEAAEPLLVAIDTAQSKARERKITELDVLDAVLQVEDHLSISKKAMTGTKVHLDRYAEKKPRAYKWTAESTQVWLERRPRGWYVTDIRRWMWGDWDTTINIRLSDTAKEAVLERMSTIR